MRGVREEGEGWITLFTCEVVVCNSYVEKCQMASKNTSLVQAQI